MLIYLNSVISWMKQYGKPEFYISLSFVTYHRK